MASGTSRRNRKSIFLTIAIIAVLAAALIGFFAWQQHAIGARDASDKTAAEDQVQEAQQDTDQDTAAPQDEEAAGSDADDAVAQQDDDIRKVKNTATEEHHKTNGLAVCMFHYIYDKNDPPDDVNNNYIEISALRDELEYLVEEEYFFPTWEEVRQYIDGDLLLPEKSVVLTFDDGKKKTLEYLDELSREYEIPITSFLITGNEGADKVEKYEDNPYLIFQSHSDDMHKAGGNIGHGGIFTAMSVDDAVADLEKSIEICGSGDAFAYPYGDYTDSCEEAVEKAGFLCAFTTENDRCQVGDDPLLLPRMRMIEGQSLQTFISCVE